MHEAFSVRVRRGQPSYRKLDIILRQHNVFLRWSITKVGKTEQPEIPSRPPERR